MIAMLYLSAKEQAECFLNLSGRCDVYFKARLVESRHIVGWDDYLGKTQLLCFADALLDAIDGSYLTRQAYLAGECDALPYLDIHV